MNIKLLFWATIPVLFSLSACYPDESEITDDRVYTNYDSQFDFKGKVSYSIPDSIIKIGGAALDDPDGDGKPAFLSPEYSGAILNSIKENMTKFGWTLVDKNNDPDVVLLVSVTTTTQVTYHYNWSYWNWWYPGSQASWGWQYRGYYYPPYVSSYRLGSVFIQMTDYSPAAETDSIPVVWNCILNGLINGSANLTPRLTESINTAFSQSAYLNH